MKNVNTKKSRRELIDHYRKRRSRILSIDCFRRKEPAEVKIIYKNGEVETIEGPQWAISRFYGEFRREILNIRV